jgi:ribosomal protein L24
MNIKKDDKVIVLSGKDKGKTGKVISADPKGMKVIVEGVNVATKHQAPKKQGEAGRHHQGRDPASTSARCSLSAPSAASPPAPPISLRTTARNPASASSAARRYERGE